MLFTDLTVGPLIHIQPNQQVVFIHITKTAGTTFKDILRLHFSSSRVCPWELLTDTPDQPEQYQLFLGHYYYHAIRKFVREDTVFLSFLRDPIDRSVSNYYQLRKVFEETPEQAPNFPKELEEFVFNDEVSSNLVNVQTRMLGQPLHFNGFHGPDGLLTRYQLENLAVASGQRLPAEAAYPVIDSLGFFGITEDFDTSMALLSHTFGWQPIQTVESKNIGSYPQPPKHVIDKIIELNQEDLKLYDYAKRVFDERVAQMRRDQQRLYYLATRARVTPRSHHVRHVFDHVNGEGWYIPENADGMDFMWTGPGEHSTLDLALAHGQDLTLRCHVLAALQDDILYALQISVNGHPIALTYHPATMGGGFEVEGVIPSTAIPQNRYFSAITFSIPYTISPHDLNPQDEDSRQLGVALAWLEVSPAGTGANAPAPVEMEANLSIDVKASAAAPDTPYTLGVQAQNTGDVAWIAAEPFDGSQPVKLGAYWVDNTGMVVPGSTTYHPLPGDVIPGGACQIALTITTPPAPGE
ncbi:MAG: sulfotransferase family protein, partial [Anaerolineae bacterium]|nr:sulfotransferase family protein [Anaerolineae bacterium]